MSDTHVENTVPGARSAPRGSGIWKTLTVLLAVACAVLAFLLLQPADDAEADDAQADGGVTATAEGSAALACAVLGDVVAIPDDEAASDEAYVHQLRLGAVQVLGMMAGAQDASLEKFAEHMQGPSAAQARAFSMEGPEFQEALDLAQSTCANRFPTED